MPYLETILTHGGTQLSKHYSEDALLSDVGIYYHDYFDMVKHEAVKAALDEAKRRREGSRNAPLVAHEAAMILHEKEIFDAAAGFLEFAFSEEIIGKPTVDDDGKPADNKAAYAIAYLFALEYWKKEVETKEEAEQRFFKDTLARKLEVIHEAICLVDLFKDRVGHHRFNIKDLEDASTLGNQFLVRASL